MRRLAIPLFVMIVLGPGWAQEPPDPILAEAQVFFVRLTGLMNDLDPSYADLYADDAAIVMAPSRPAGYAQRWADIER